MAPQDQPETPKAVPDGFYTTVRIDSDSGFPHVAFDHTLTAQQREVAARAGLTAATDVMMHRHGLHPGTPREVHFIAPGGLPGPILTITTRHRTNGHVWFTSDPEVEPDVSTAHVEIGLKYATTDLATTERESDD